MALMMICVHVLFFDTWHPAFWADARLRRYCADTKALVYRCRCQCSGSFFFVWLMPASSFFSVLFFFGPQNRCASLASRFVAFVFFPARFCCPSFAPEVKRPVQLTVTGKANFCFFRRSTFPCLNSHPVSPLNSSSGPLSPQWVQQYG